MSDDFLKVKKGLNVKPQSAAPTNQENGDIFYETGRGTHSVVASGQAMDLSSSVSVAGVASMTSAQMTAAALRSNVVTITGAVGVTLHGMAAMQNGRQITVINATNQVMLIPSESGSEGTPANRIHTAGAVTISVVSGGAITIVRDGPTGRWRAAFPTTPVVQKKTGSFTWNLNGVTSATTGGEYDGRRVLPTGSAFSVTWKSMVVAPGVTSGTLSATIQYWNSGTSTWVSMGTLSIGAGGSIVHQSNITAIPSNASGVSDGILIRCVFGMTTLVIPTANAAVTIYWQET